jgi:hypothetical protein
VPDWGIGTSYRIGGSRHYVRALPTAIRSAAHAIVNATRRSERLEVAAGPGVDSIVLGGSRQGSLPVVADRACELDAVEAGNQPPNLQRIEARIGIVKIHPGVERDSHPAAVGFADKPDTTFGTMNADVLAEKLPGYVRPNFCAIIRGSKHST